MQHHQRPEELLNANDDQVFMLTCRASIPAQFAAHQWFVINRHGVLSRWEVLHRNLKNATRWGHLYKDQFPPFEGLEIVLPFRRYLWSATVLSVIQGDGARHAAALIEESPQKYPYCHRYSFIGPNSNTYSQWVLSHVPEFGVSLAWNAFGKGYPIVGE